MSTAVAVFHGRFGRATLYRLDRPMITHAHREGHVIFHVGGAPGLVDVGGRPRPLGPRAGVAVNPWEPHAFSPGAGPDPGLFLVLYVDPGWFLRAHGGPRCALRFGASEIEVTDRIGEAAVRLTELLLAGRSMDLLGPLLHDLTDRCFEGSWRDAAPAPAAEPGGAGDFRVRKSIQLLVQGLGAGGEVRLDRVAREAGLSRPHFYKLFRKHTGVTPNLYLNTLVMERAIETLTRTTKSVTEIGFELGFAAQSGFTRFFAAHVGMAPTEYRRAAQVLAH